MVSLSDRLDYVVGAKAADLLDEVFGIRTVDDLLRHYPRSYTEGATRWDADGSVHERPEAGEHITIVDTIAETKSFPMKKDPKKKCLPHHRGLRSQQGDRHVLQRELHQEGPHQGHQGDAVRRGRVLPGTTCS